MLDTDVLLSLVDDLNNNTWKSKREKESSISVRPPSPVSFLPSHPPILSPLPSFPIRTTDGLFAH